MTAMSSGRTIFSVMKPIACGLDISDYSAELVALSQVKGRVQVEAFGRTEIPAGLVRRGVIQQPDKLVGVLKTLFSRTLGSKRDRIVLGVSLPESQIYSKVFRLPANLGLDLAVKAAAMEAQDYFPLPLNNIAVDTIVLSRSKDTQDLYYAVADRDVAQAYRDVLRQVAVEPQFLDSETQALARSFGLPGTEPVLIADIGAGTTLLTVCDQDGIRFSSSVVLGGNRLTSAIEIQLNVPLDKAENLKRRAGFDPTAETGRVFLILQKPMTELIEEIRKTLAYYARRTGRSVGKIILAGGTSLTPEIAPYIESNIPEVSVAVGQPFREIGTAPSLSTNDLKNNAILYSTAVGLALRAGGFRRGPGLDLRPDGPAGGRGAAAFLEKARHVGLALISMVKRKPAKSRKKSAAPKKPEAPVEEQELQPQPAPEAEEAKIREPAEPPPAEEPTPVEEPALGPPPAEPPPSDEPPLAHAVSSLLDSSRYDLPSGEPAEEKPEDSAGDMPAITQRGSRVLWVDSIIAGNKTAPPDDQEEPAEPEPAEGKKPFLLLWVVLVLVLVVIAAAGVVMFGRKTGVTVASVWSSATALFQKGPAQLQDQPDAGLGQPSGPTVETTVSQVVLVGLEKRPGGTTPSVASRVVETDVTASGDFPATGQATAKSSGTATGKLTIINTTAESYTFVATTRCLSEDGVLFRLKKATNIPANGTVETEVYADKSGPSGDIGPTTFTIPGLSAELQKKIYAESSSAMSGGGSTAKGVSGDDLAQAKAVLMEKLTAEALADLKAMANASETVLADLITSQELSDKAPAAGTAGDSFNMKLTVRFRALLLPQAEVESLLVSRLQETLPEGAVLADYELGAAQYTVEAYDTETDLAEVRAEAPVKKL